MTVNLTAIENEARAAYTQYLRETGQPFEEKDQIMFRIGWFTGRLALLNQQIAERAERHRTALAELGVV